MLRISLASLALGLVAFFTSADEPKANDTAHLGTWKQVAAVADGKELAVGSATMLIVKDDGYTVTVDGKDFQKGTSKVDRTKSPQTSEVTVASGYLAGQKLKQISKIDGDVMIACIGVERPQEFKSKPGSGHTLSVWIRVK
jgi:uncharacterized protein (TIGR03067 family)